MSKRCIALFAASCLTVAGFTQTSRASDTPPARHDTMMTMVKDKMMKMKEMMSDPQAVQKAHEHMTRMMVMEHMSHKLAMDPEFQQMHDEMMKDPAVMKMMDEQKMMMSDKDAMMKMHEQIMADPHAMDMVVNHALMMDMKMRHPEMMKTGDKPQDSKGEK